MGFEFGEASHVFAAGQHPRLIWLESDRKRLLEKTADGDLALVLAKFMSLAREDAARTLDGPTFDALYGGKPARGFLATPIQLDRLAVASWIDPADEALFQAARKILMWNAEVDRPASDRPYFEGGSYGHALGYDLLYHRLTSSDRKTIGQWLLDFGVVNQLKLIEPFFLRAPGANIPMVGMMQTAVNLLAVINDPDMPDLSRERDVLMRFLDASIQSTSGTHGYPAEDIGYGTSCSARLFIVASIAARAGYYDVKTVCPPALNFGRAMLHFVQPWGEYLSNTGDHADDFGHREFVLPRLAAITNDPTVLWLMQTIFYPPYTRQWVGRDKEYPELKTSDGRNIPVSWRTLAAADYFAPPVHPSQAKVPTQFMDNSRGLVSFRSGWEPDATFVYLDGAHRPTISQGHEHDSAGHFALTAMGEYFGISPGRYNMDQTCHSVVLVDGKTGHDTDGQWRHTVYHGQLTSYSPHDFVDATSCDNSQQSNCYWSYRTLALVKGLGHGMPSYVWTLDDVNPDHGKVMPREFWWTLHTSPGNTIATGERSATITGCRHGNKLDVFFANPESASLPAPYRLIVTQDEVTPSSWRYIPKERIDAERENFKDVPWDQIHGSVFFRPRLVGKFSGPSGKFLTLMVPREKSAPAPVFTRLAGIDAQIAVTLRVGNIQDTIICAYGHKILTVSDIDARGDWLVVRRDVATGVVLAHRLSGGSYLKVAGRRIV